LADGATQCFAEIAHIHALAAVFEAHVKLVFTQALQRKALVVAADKFPLMDIGAVGRRNLRNIDGFAAGYVDQPVIALRILDQLKSPEGVVVAGPLDDARAVGLQAAVYPKAKVAECRSHHVAAIGQVGGLAGAAKSRAKGQCQQMLFCMNHFVCLLVSRTRECAGVASNTLTESGSATIHARSYRKVFAVNRFGPPIICRERKTASCKISVKDVAA
jgi:hypothetical protein